MEKIDRDVLSEVYEILSFLEDRSFYKIPKEVLDFIEEERNKDYEYSLDVTLPFEKQKMLDRTKEILFEIYRDYLAEAEKKKKIIEYQEIEKNINELLNI